MYRVQYICECHGCGRTAPARVPDQPSLPAGWIAIPLPRGVGVPCTEGHACCEACAVRLLLAPRMPALADAMPAILAAVSGLPQEAAAAREASHADA